MIEFKAECGHTLRVNDDEAGKVVRCAACGRPAQAPAKPEADLSSLFRELDEKGVPVREKRRSSGFFRRRRRRPNEVDPFAIAYRLCYVALLLIVLIVVGKKVVWPLLDPDERARRLRADSAEGGPDGVDTDDASGVNRRGLIGRGRIEGLYVQSTPPDADVYCVDESRAPDHGRIHHLPGGIRLRASGEPVRLNDGFYVVEVSFAWNDPKLSDASLSDHRNYVAFRRAIERAGDEERRRLVKDYFLPDDATDVFIDQTPDQIYIVRQYRGVVVQKNRSEGVRALFLPRLKVREDGFFKIDPLLNGYILPEKRYRFDENHARSELTYYGVAEADQPTVLEALSRIGAIPYLTPDGVTRLFKVGIHDGAFAMAVTGASTP